MSKIKTTKEWFNTGETHGRQKAEEKIETIKTELPSYIWQRIKEAGYSSEDEIKGMKERVLSIFINQEIDRILEQNKN